MFKLVVVCAFFAAVAAKPSGLLVTPLSSLNSVVSPGVTTYSNQFSSVVQPSPIVYSTPLSYAHLIKKRSPQWPITYVTPNTYLTSSPLAATTYTSPLIHTAPAVTLPLTTTHLIKKRSAPLLSTTYIAPTTYTAASIVPSTYTANAPLISTPYLTSSPLISQPLTYSTHFIKKRSVVAPSTYIAPASFSHQSRIDLNGVPLVSTYSSPLVYSTPVGALSHIF